MTQEKGKGSSHQRRPIVAKRKKAFIDAYDKTLCNVSSACKVVKISRNTFYHWCKTDESFKERIDELNEEAVDFAESMLKKNIREQKEASIFFFLKTKGKHRGYIETVQADVTVNPFIELMKAATEEDEGQ